MNIKFSVSTTSTFLKAFIELPKNIQKKTVELVDKLRENPFANGLNYEKIQNSYDKNVRSIRIDKSYRAIILKSEKNLFYLLYADQHNDAYAWAQNQH